MRRRTILRAGVIAGGLLLVAGLVGKILWRKAFPPLPATLSVDHSLSAHRPVVASSHSCPVCASARVMAPGPSPARRVTHPSSFTGLWQMRETDSRRALSTSVFLLDFELQTMRRRSAIYAQKLSAHILRLRGATWKAEGVAVNEPETWNALHLRITPPAWLGQALSLRFNAGKRRWTGALVLAGTSEPVTFTRPLNYKAGDPLVGDWRVVRTQNPQGVPRGSSFHLAVAPEGQLIGWKNIDSKFGSYGSPLTVLGRNRQAIWFRWVIPPEVDVSAIEQPVSDKLSITRAPGLLRWESLATVAWTRREPH